MRALVDRYPDDLDAATLYAESLMDLHPWQLWAATTAHRRKARLEIVAVLESVLRTRSQTRRRESLLHPRDRSLADAGSRARQRQAPRNAGAGRRPSRAHAGAHVHANRQLRGRGAKRMRTPPKSIANTSRRRGIERLLPDDVLQPQSGFSRVGCDDDRAIRAAPRRRQTSS